MSAGMKKDEKKKKGEEIEIIHPNRTCKQKGSIAGASFTHLNRKLTGSRGKEELKMDWLKKKKKRFSIKMKIQIQI